jgi:Mn-dependent DtxR family transcriptional regulator
MTKEIILTTMPIDIGTFTEASNDELSETTNAEKVVRFLSKNDDKAFTPSEIADGTEVKKSSIGTVLRRLEDRDLVRHKGDYWAIGDEETIRDAFRFHRVMEDLNDQFGLEDIGGWREHAADRGDE